MWKGEGVREGGRKVARAVKKVKGKGGEVSQMWAGGDKVSRVQLLDEKRKV